MAENRHIVYVDRKKDADILTFLKLKTDHKNVLMVEGPRQVGKTWLVEHAIARSKAHSVQINLERDRRLRSLIDECEDFQEYEEVLKDRLGFDGASGQILFIDEAQESSKLGHFVRFMKEEWVRATVVLSGSSLRRLFRSETRFPVGRVGRLLLRPFSFSEFLNARNQPHLARQILAVEDRSSTARHENLLELFDEYIANGGLPAVVCAIPEIETPRETLARILADYENDFVRLLGENSAHIAKACLRSVANHLGNVSKNTSVFPSANGFHSRRIGEILARLEGWHLLIRSEQLSPTPEQSHNYLPKRYIFDTGVARHLREAAVPAIRMLHTVAADSRKPLGGVIENQTAIELVQQYGAVQGWKKSSSGMEVDFVVKESDNTFPVECKASLEINMRHLKGIIEYLERYDMPLGFVVSLAPYRVFHPRPERTVINIPAYSIESFHNHITRHIWPQSVGGHT